MSPKPQRQLKYINETINNKTTNNISQQLYASTKINTTHTGRPTKSNPGQYFHHKTCGSHPRPLRSRLAPMSQNQPNGPLWVVGLKTKQPKMEVSQPKKIIQTQKQ